jgi:hypothetical protein
MHIGPKDEETCEKVCLKVEGEEREKQANLMQKEKIK